MNIVQADNLSRFYGIVLGLNNVTFCIHPGITGVIGPNGAGKTTLFRLILGQVKPSSGDLLVFGQSPWKNRSVQSRIAYCPESENVPSGLNPVEWLVGLGMISGLSASEAKTRTGEVLEQVKLAPENWKKRLTQLSKGTRQRVKLAQCLLHHPELIILDEPMNGLDPMGREDMGNVIRDLAQGGTSIIVSSHILHDLETLCREFLLLRWGRVPRSSNEILSEANRKQWPASTRFRCASPKLLARYFFEQGLLQGCDLGPDDDALQVRWTDPSRFYTEFDRLLLDSGVPIFEISNPESSLEKVMQSTTVL